MDEDHLDYNYYTAFDIMVENEDWEVLPVASRDDKEFDYDDDDDMLSDSDSDSDSDDDVDVVDVGWRIIW